MIMRVACDSLIVILVGYVGIRCARRSIHCALIDIRGPGLVMEVGRNALIGFYITPAWFGRFVTASIEKNYDVVYTVVYEHARQ